MAVFKCTKCHHEWQATLGIPESSKCDWCGAPGKKLADDYMEGGGNEVVILKAAIRGALVEWYSERGEGVSGTELDRVSDKILNALQEAVKHGEEK